VGPQGRSLGHWGRVFEGDCGAVVPSCFSLASCHEVGHFPLPCSTAIMFYVSTGRKATGPCSHGLKPPGCEPESAFSLRKLVISGIVIVMERWMAQVHA
jgi:hypothetical protein